MRPEKCPSCGGYCCTGNLFGNKVRHTAEWGFEHECLRCPDGYTPTPKPPERTAATERAAVVAWLRAQAYLTLHDDKPHDIADRIERGEHRHEGVE